MNPGCGRSSLSIKRTTAAPFHIPLPTISGIHGSGVFKQLMHTPKIQSHTYAPLRQIPGYLLPLVNFWNRFWSALRSSPHRIRWSNLSALKYEPKHTDSSHTLLVLSSHMKKQLHSSRNNELRQLHTTACSFSLLSVAPVIWGKREIWSITCSLQSQWKLNLIKIYHSGEFLPQEKSDKQESSNILHTYTHTPDRPGFSLHHWDLIMYVQAQLIY